MAVLQVQAPGGFVPETAIGFGAVGGGVSPVAADNPLPVATRASQAAAVAAPLAGSATASGSFGPFAPELGRAIWVTLSGSWAGSATLKRSTDGGATRLPLTFIDGSPKGVWTGNVNAAVGEESVAGAALYLDVALTSGTLSFRVEQ